MDNNACFNCGKTFELVWPDQQYRRKTDRPEYLRTLKVTLSGGYGGYVDGRVSVEICKECADKLGEDVPYLKVALNQYLDNI